MRRPSLLQRSRVLDLIAFVMVLATGVTLVALGLSPESLAAVTIALASLYTAWRTGQPPVAQPVEAEPRRKAGLGRAVKDTEEDAGHPAVESADSTDPS